MRKRLLLLCSTLTGCAGFTPPAPAPVRQPQAVAASFEKTWNAVIDILGDNNIPVTTIDKNSGFVVAERASIPSTSKADHDFAMTLADCGKGSTGLTFPPTTARYNIVVRPVADGATVKATATYRRIVGSLGAANCSSRGTFESQLESEIKKRAESPR